MAHIVAGVVLVFAVVCGFQVETASAGGKLFTVLQGELPQGGQFVAVPINVSAFSRISFLANTVGNNVSLQFAFASEPATYFDNSGIPRIQIAQCGISQGFGVEHCNGQIGGNSSVGPSDGVYRVAGPYLLIAINGLAFQPFSLKVYAAK